MMLPSIMPARTIPVGLGQAVSQQTFDSLTAMKPPSGYPAWCSWMPFADSFQACKVPTAAEQNAAIKADIEKAAGAGTANYNPDLAAEQYEAYLADSAAYCAAHPDECKEYQTAGENPTCTAIVGAGTFGQTFCKNPSTYLLLGTAAVIAIVLSTKGGR